MTTVWCRAARLAGLLGLASLATGCRFLENAAITVAPHLGQTADCVPWQPPAADAKAWLARHAGDAPASWYAFEDWLADQVRPKLDKDCG